MTSVMTMHIELTASFTLEKIGNVYAVPTNLYIYIYINKEMPSFRHAKKVTELNRSTTNQKLMNK